MDQKSPTAPASLGRTLNFAAGAGNAVCTRLLEPHGLSLAQWAILSALWRNGDLGVTELARLTGNAPPAVSRLVDRMLAAGLLLRQPCPADRRAVRIGLSPTAEALRPLQTVYRQVNEVLLRDFTPEEAALLEALLWRVEKNGRDWLAGE